MYNETWFIVGKFERQYMVEGYKTISEISKEWKLKPRTIQIMCAKGKLEGATKAGNVWLIPNNTEKPVDLRIKSGKYIKDNCGQVDKKC